jgi:GH15 family glucan-1,4-alpha-glucosidase
VARAFFIGNGELAATGDRSGALLECYAPALSPETQLLRRPARIGIAVDGILRWLPDGFETRAGDPDDPALPDLSLLSSDLDLECWLECFTDCRLPVLYRRIQITNRGPVHRALSLYFHHDLRLASGRPHERAWRDAESGAILHASGRHAVLFNLEGPEGFGVPLVRIASRAREEVAGADAEALDGHRRPRGEASGFADSVGGVALSLPAASSAMLTAWLACAETPDAARALDARVRRDGVAAAVSRTRGHWRVWAQQGAADLADLPEAVGNVYASSLLVLRLHQTPEGAIVSGVEDPSAEPSSRAPATGLHGEPRWCWSADAAIAADALGGAGYHGAARRYFAFVAEAASGGAAACGVSGGLAAAYEPSGQPVLIAGAEDASLLGTALHLWAAARHAERERDIEFWGPMWEPLLVPSADRLAGSIDARTGLPRSLDWWGERAGYHASVSGAVRGGLRGAARLAAALGEPARARAWAAAGDTIARAMTARLTERVSAVPDGVAGAHGDRRFSRALLETGEGRERDDAIDASLLTIGLLDDFEPEDPRVAATVAAVRERLWVRTGTGGLARYEGDPIGSVGGGGADVPGSPHVAPTLWLALHAIRAARKLQDLEPARTILFWAAARAEGAGLLPERLHPYRGRTTAPAPSLTAHAWFVRAAVEYAERARELTRCERCGEPAPARRVRGRRGGVTSAALAARSLPGVVPDL